MWKGFAILCATLVSFSQGFGPLALVSGSESEKSVESMLTITKAPMFGDYIQAFNRDLTDVVQFTGVAILVLGFSNFIW